MHSVPSDTVSNPILYNFCAMIKWQIQNKFWKNNSNGSKLISCGICGIKTKWKIFWNKTAIVAFHEEKKLEDSAKLT